LRTAGNLVLELSDEALQDEMVAGGSTFVLNWGASGLYEGFSTAQDQSPALGSSTPFPVAISGTELIGFYVLGTTLVIVVAGASAPSAFALSYTDPNGNPWVFAWNGSAMTITGTDQPTGSIYGVGVNNTYQMAMTWGTGTPPAVNSTGSSTFTLASTGSQMTGTNFYSWMQWPYLSLGNFAGSKQMEGIDLVGSGAVSIQIATREDDNSTFIDQPGFSTSENVTPAYMIDVADTPPGTPIPIPVTAPSISVILQWEPNQPWLFEAANMYLIDNKGAGFFAPG
jgi:hypothetical protein